MIALFALAALVAVPSDDPATALEATGRYRDAEPLRRAELVRAGSGDNENVASAAERLADNLALQARAAEAEPLYRQALQMRLKLYGDANLDTARNLSQLAALLAEDGRLGEAEPLASRAMGITGILAGKKSVAYAKTVGTYAALLAALGRSDQAYIAYVDTVEILTSAGKVAELDRAVALNNLAAHLLRAARRDTAPRAFRRTTDMRQSVVLPVAGSEGARAEQAETRTALLKEAQRLAELALGIRERRLGEFHPDTANSLNSLAAIQRARAAAAAAEGFAPGDWLGRAETAYRRAYAIKLRLLPTDDRDRIVGAWSLAGIAETIGRARHAEARTLYRTAGMGALRAQGRHREFNRAASAELRSYKPVFEGQVRVNWRLANPS